MRVAVTGAGGQVGAALIERAQIAQSQGLPMTLIGPARDALDLEKPDDIHRVIESIRPDLVINAAAYTAVDLAEREADRAWAVNDRGAGALAAAAAAIGAPIVHLSTDYVFDGQGLRPYEETDTPAPLSVYGASKLAGERAVAAANPRHLILRTAWIYAPRGRNFVRTMLELARTRDEVSVVADQIGAPTYAPDLADAVLALLAGLADPPGDRWGVFHMSAAGETSWAGFAEAIFDGAGARGAPAATVRPITTADYPTPARRPANSRLNNARLAAVHGVALPDWRGGLERCLDRLLGPRAAGGSP